MPIDAMLHSSTITDNAEALIRRDSKHAQRTTISSRLARDYAISRGAQDGSNTACCRTAGSYKKSTQTKTSTWLLEREHGCHRRAHCGGSESPFTPGWWDQYCWRCRTTRVSRYHWAPGDPTRIWVCARYRHKRENDDE